MSSRPEPIGVKAPKRSAASSPTPAPAGPSTSAPIAKRPRSPSRSPAAAAPGGGQAAPLELGDLLIQTAPFDLERLLVDAPPAGAQGNRSRPDAEGGAEGETTAQAVDRFLAGLEAGVRVGKHSVGYVGRVRVEPRVRAADWSEGKARFWEEQHRFIEYAHRSPYLRSLAAKVTNPAYDHSVYFFAKLATDETGTITPTDALDPFSHFARCARCAGVICTELAGTEYVKEVIPDRRGRPRRTNEVVYHPLCYYLLRGGELKWIAQEDGKAVRDGKDPAEDESLLSALALTDHRRAPRHLAYSSQFLTEEAVSWAGIADKRTLLAARLRRALDEADLARLDRPRRVLCRYSPNDNLFVSVDDNLVLVGSRTAPKAPETEDALAVPTVLETRRAEAALFPPTEFSPADIEEVKVRHDRRYNLEVAVRLRSGRILRTVATDLADKPLPR